MRELSTLLLLVLAVTIAGPAAGKKRRRVKRKAAPVQSTTKTTSVAVTGVRTLGNTDSALAEQITQRLAAELGAASNVSVITPSDIRSMLEHESKRQLLGCEDDACMTEIAGALGVDLLISGHLSKVEDGLVLAISVIDPNEASAKQHLSETWRGEPIAILDLAAAMVDGLLHGEGRGSLEVVGATAGSQILVDDQLRAQIPAAPIEDLETGAHRVQVIAKDKQPFIAWVIIRRNRRTSLAAEQLDPPRPLYQTWWFWTATGVVVAGAGAATYLLLRDNGGAGQTGASFSVNADDAFQGGR